MAEGADGGREVHAALRRLGFRDAEARAALAKARARVATTAPLEALLREALRSTRPEQAWTEAARDGARSAPT